MTNAPGTKEKATMANATTKSRPLAQLCTCGRQVVQYVTAQGWKSAPYCADCAKRESNR